MPLPSKESLLATADEAEARAAVKEGEAASLREFAAELRKAAEKAPRGLPDVNMPGKVNTSTMETQAANRFWSKVKKGDGCWEWQRGKTVTGYGVANFGDITLAHRASWTLTNGPIPAGLHVLHTCDNPGCVRPDHLFLGDQASNMADKKAKGRHMLGDMVTEHRVAISKGRDAKDAFLMAIRAKGYTLRSLAKKLDVPPSLLSMHRASKASGNGRPIPRARAERIEKLTDWPADLAHWPNGFA